MNTNSTTRSANCMVDSSSSSRTSSYDSLMSEASAWSSSTVTSSNSSYTALPTVDDTKLSADTQDLCYNNTDHHDDELLTFTPSPHSGFRDNAISIARLMTPETRLTVVQMATQLSHVLPTSGHSSVKWNQYAARIASLYDPAKYDSYRVLNQRAYIAIHQLNSFQFSTFPDPATMSHPQYAASLHAWVQKNIVNGIEKQVLANTPLIRNIVTQRSGLAAAAREKVLFSYFWDHREQASSVLNSVHTHNVNENMEMFQCFTYTPRYMFLMNLLRIASTISTKIQEAVPAPVAAKMDSFFVPATTSKLIQATAGPASLTDLVPTSLDQYRTFFSSEIFSKLATAHNPAGLFTKHSPTSQIPQPACALNSFHVNVAPFTEQGYSPSDLANQLNLAPCPECATCAPGCFLDNPLAIILGSDASYIDVDGSASAACYGLSVKVIA